MFGRKYKVKNAKAMVSLRTYAKNAKGAVKEKVNQFKKASRFVYLEDSGWHKKIGTKAEIKKGNYKIHEKERYLGVYIETTSQYVNGKLKSKLEQFSNDNYEQVTTFRQDGTKEQFTIYNKNNGAILEQNTYYENGKKRSGELYRQDGTLESKFTASRDGKAKQIFYDKYGNVNDVIKFIGGNKVSESHYEYNGIETEMSTEELFDYDKDNMPTTSKTYDKDGNLIKSVMYGRRKAMSRSIGKVSYSYYTAQETEYYPGGQVKSVVQNYENWQERSRINYDAQGNKTYAVLYAPDGTVKSSSGVMSENSKDEKGNSGENLDEASLSVKGKVPPIPPKNTTAERNEVKDEKQNVAETKSTPSSSPNGGVEEESREYTYYDNGNIKTELVKEFGVNILTRTYRPDGTLDTEIAYYYEDDNIKSKSEYYKNGNEKSIETYYFSGIIMEKEECSLDGHQRTITEYDESGEVEAIEKYVNDKKVSRSKYEQNGDETVKTSEIIFEYDDDGVYKGLKTYDADGDLIRATAYNRVGEQSRETSIEYYKDGQKKSVVEYDESGKERIRVEYDKNGKKISESVSYNAMGNEPRDFNGRTK